MGQRAVCDGGDEVDWHLTQTGVVKEGLDALQEVIDYTLGGDMGLIISILWNYENWHEEEID